MGQVGNDLEILVIDPDEMFQAELTRRSIVGTHLTLLDIGVITASHSRLAQSDVIVIGVDLPTGLSLLADICERPGMPPVIAVGGASISGKPAEHVLLQAELRGAALSLPKPLEAGDVVLAAAALVGARRGRPLPDARGRKPAARETAFRAKP